MKSTDLTPRLLELGCSPHNFSVGYRGSDVFCLEDQQGLWCVFYTERGGEGEHIFESPDEETACDFFYNYILTKIQHRHLVGFFKDEARAQDLRAKLRGHGIATEQDKIPYGGWADPRYRVFVIGKDIFKVRDLLGQLPIMEQP